MAIKTSDLVYLEEQVGYGAKASVYRTDSGLCIYIGKQYEGLGVVAARLNLSDEEVDELENNKFELVSFASACAGRFDKALGGRFLK